MQPKHRVRFLLAAGAIGFSAGEAAATGFQIRENSATGLGTAFAGAASAADDISTIYNNPAGMTRFSGHQAGVVGSVVGTSVKFSGTGSAATGSKLSGGEGGDAGGYFLVPAGYLLYDYAPDLKFGLAVTSPFGLTTEYDSDWVGRYQGIRSELQTISVNPNIAYRVNDWLSVGGGIVVQYAKAELTNAVNSRTISGGAPLADGLFKVTGDDVGFGFNLAVLIEPRADTRFGLTYRSKINQTIKGDIDFTMPAPLSALAAFGDSGGRASTTLPEIVTASVYHDLTPQLAIMADVQWTRWSRFKSLVIERDDGTVVRDQPQNWESTYFFSLGAAYKLDSAWTLRAGVAYDQSPVKDEFRTVRLPDEDRFWLAFGVGYRWNDAVVFDAAYARNFIRDGQIDERSATNDRLTGTYKTSIDLFAVSARIRF